MLYVLMDNMSFSQAENKHMLAYFNGSTHVLSNMLQFQCNIIWLE